MTYDLTNSSIAPITPKIYVACLASYNNGILYGTWIALDQPLKNVFEQIRRLLDKSPIPGAEEIAVHDFEDFGSLRINEYDSITMIHKQAQFIIAHGALGAELLAHYAGSLEEAEEALDNYYVGEHDSELEYAIHFFEECYLHNIPKNVQSYIDYEKFCRDVFVQDFFSLDVNGSCHVFMAH